MLRTSFRGGCIAAALLSVSCSSTAEEPRRASDASVDAPLDPPSVSATVKKPAKMEIGAIVSVTATPRSTVHVEYGDTSSYGQTTPKHEVPASGTLTVHVIGLTMKSTAHLRAVAEKDGLVARTADLTLSTGALPHDISQQLEIVATSSGVEGYFLLGLINLPSKVAIDVMVDRKGKIVWYWAPPGKDPIPSHVDRIRGRFLAAEGVTDVFHELDLAGETVRTWRNTGAGGTLDAHDFLLLPNGHAMMIGWDESTIDSRPYFTGGVENAVRLDHTIDEIDPTGKAVWHWSTRDQIMPDEHIDDPSGITPKLDPTHFETAHMNSIDVAPDGNIVASLRATSSVIKVSRSEKKILWRMGGKKNEFTFVGDPLHGFSMQHDARFSKDGKELLLLDNGNAHSPPVTRAVRYRVDEVAKTATLVWEYRHVPDLFSPFAGSVRVLPNGHVVTVFSRMGVVTEIEATTKKVVWELKSRYFGVYRAMFTPTLYP